METLIPLITLPAIAGLGFLTRKTGYIDEEAFSHLPQLMLRLCYPLLILTSLLRTDLRTILAESLTAVLGTAGLTLALYFVGRLLFRRADPKRRPIYLFNLSIGNIVYVTLPVTSALFGPEGVVLTMLCTTTQDLFLWSLYHLEFRRQEGRASLLRAVANPCTASLLLGVILSLLRVPFPSWLEFASTLASLTSPLGMLFIGATLVGCNLRTIFRGPVLLTSGLKVLAVPALACILFFLISGDAGFTAIMTLYFASPCALLSAVWAKEYDRDLDMAAGSVLVSTVLFFLGVGVYALIR